MSFSTYILECSDQTYYVGCTNNLEKRLKQHNKKRWGAHYTNIRRPVTLKYSESYETLSEARRREREIKGWRREKKEKLWQKTIKERLKEVISAASPNPSILLRTRLSARKGR